MRSCASGSRANRCAFRRTRCRLVRPARRAGEPSPPCRLVRARPPRARGRGAVLRAPLRHDALGHPHAARQRRMGRPRAGLRARARGARTRRRADAGEALWLAYYRSIFNPARVKVAMMKKEMPVRFWKNLPEAAAVPELLAQAPQREQRMVDAGGAGARARRRGQRGGRRARREDAAPTRPGRRRVAGRARAPRRALPRLPRRRRRHPDRVRRRATPAPA